MPSEKKIKTLEKTKDIIGKYPVIGILNLHKLPAKQLFDIRNKLRGKAVIKTLKKRIMIMALKDNGLEKLAEYIEQEPSLILSSENPFKLARIISESKSKAIAKAGDIAPEKIVVKAGPTNVPPGPVIGEFQRAKIPVGIEGDKIAIKKDTVVAKAGDVITADQAGILAKLGVEPMEIGLNLVAINEKGIIYGKDILFVPQEEYIRKIKDAALAALNLSCHVGYVTKDNIKILLSKANREAISVAEKAGIINSETVKPLLAKADAQAKALGKHEKAHEEKNEEVKKEEKAN